MTKTESVLESVDAVVVGAGVIGLAVAGEIARSGQEVVILEREAVFGAHTSSRNSEVIHAGIYYPAGSLKANLCVDGRERLYAYCESRGIAHRQCGKLIVATEEGQRGALERIALRAGAAGVALEWLSGSAAIALEPALRGQFALLSRVSGIIDSHGLMLSLLGEAEDHGAVLVSRTRFVAAEVAAQEGFVLELEGPDGRMRVRCRWLVNASGLFASEVARRIDGLAAGFIPETRYAKGNYFSLSRRAPFSRLIYPVPNEAGLGVHLTLDLAGRARFGPDVEWCREVDYEVSSARAVQFYDEIRAYWPGLPEGALVADYCGIRPKLVGEGDVAADFQIDGFGQHGVPGLVNLFGIESPGLTACLSLGREVLARLRG